MASPRRNAPRVDGERYARHTVHQLDRRLDGQLLYVNQLKLTNQKLIGAEKFAISKLVEYGDTVFLVLRKRPVTFLHWFHHTTVGLLID